MTAVWSVHDINSIKYATETQTAAAQVTENQASFVFTLKMR